MQYFCVHDKDVEKPLFLFKWKKNGKIIMQIARYIFMELHTNVYIYLLSMPHYYHIIDSHPIKHGMIKNKSIYTFAINSTKISD